MRKVLDPSTEVFRKAFGALMLHNPWGTGMGIAFGCLLQLVAGIIDPVLVQHGLGSVERYGAIPFYGTGVFILNLITRRKRSPECRELEAEVDRIEELHRKKLITDANARLHCNALLTKRLTDIKVLKQPERAD